MGVIYKLKTEIKNWLLEKRRTNPALSCRGLVSLLENEFKINVSKSSINSIIKAAGLSMPVGRRRKKRRRKIREIPLKLLAAPIEKPTETPAAPLQIQPASPIETPILAQIPTEIKQKMFSSGIILLKAADYLIGGSYYIHETIRKRLRLRDENLLAKAEELIYAPLLEMPEESFKACFNELIQTIEPIAQDIFRVLSGILTEVRCIKVLLSDGETLYLDGQLHTIWSVPNIPYDFVNTIYNIKSYINNYFYKDEPFILFMAPGYDIPTPELFNFTLSLGNQGNNIIRLSLYGNELEELESIQLEQDKKHFLVFGLWPWQFTEYRRVKKIGEFKPFYFQMQRKNLYLADIEIELSGSNKNQLITLSGCVLKTNLSEKTRLVILSNGPVELTKPEYLANIYLSHWPNLEEAFQDFSRKVELFTYTASSQSFISPESLSLNQGTSDIKQLFHWYLRILDLYVKQHFLPSGYENKDFSTLKEEFYALKVVSQEQKDYILATFQPPQGFPSLKPLEYACRRLNEREIVFSDGKRLWFSL